MNLSPIISTSAPLKTIRVRQKASRAVAAVRDPKPASGSVGKRMYATAQTSRLTSDWGITITSADAEILVSAIAVRSRLRIAERDDDYFRGMLMLLENNVVGDHGIRLRMCCQNSSGKLDEGLNHAIEDAWEDYLDEESCTVSRERNGIEVQRLTIRTLARDGVLLHRKYPGFRNDYGFAIDPIEVDRLDHWWNRPSVGDANEIKFGIERDQFKAALFYWILTRHPGDVFAYSSSPRYRERVPSEQIIPIWTIERAGQWIGMPLWPSVSKRLRNLWGYEESEQIAARVAANKAGFFEVDPKTAGVDEYVGDAVDQQGNKLVDMQPGQFEQLPAGWKANLIDPKHPTEAFAHFLKAQLRGASAGSGIPYNSVAQDLESVNYSSYKAGMNDARDGFKYLQVLMVRKLMRPWFKAWLPFAVLSGKIKGVVMGDLSKISGCDFWKPRRWAGLEPLKEMQAYVLSIEAGLDSARNIIEEQFDRDIETVYQEQEMDNLLADEHHLDFSAAGIKKPTLGSGPVDTETQQGSGGDGEGGVTGNKGHTWNGHTEQVKELVKELRFQRQDFRRLSERQLVALEKSPEAKVQPITVNVEAKAGKKVSKLVRDDAGNIIGLETTTE